MVRLRGEVDFVACDPGVSLRSASGYGLTSLWDEFVRLENLAPLLLLTRARLGQPVPQH